MANSFRDLLVWQRAKRLAVDVYRATEKFPRSETYGLTAQMRSAAVSIASNIAEGQGRVTSGEFQQFLGHARGSLLELQTQCEIAADLGYVGEAELKRLGENLGEVLFLLNRLMTSLRAKPKAATN